MNYTNPSDELYGIHIAIQIYLDRYDDLLDTNFCKSMEKLSGDILDYFQAGDPEKNITERHRRKLTKANKSGTLETSDA